MKRRVISLVLTICVCLSMLSLVVSASTNEGCDIVTGDANTDVTFKVRTGSSWFGKSIVLEGTKGQAQGVNYNLYDTYGYYNIYVTDSAGEKVVDEVWHDGSYKIKLPKNNEIYTICVSPWNHQSMHVVNMIPPHWGHIGWKLTPVWAVTKEKNATFLHNYKTMKKGDGTYAAMCQVCFHVYDMPTLDTSVAGIYSGKSNASEGQISNSPYRDGKLGSPVPNQQYSVVGKVKNAYDNEWYKLSDDNWIYSGYLTPVSNVSNSRNDYQSPNYYEGDTAGDSSGVNNNNTPAAPNYVTVEWVNQSAMEACVSWPTVEGAASYEVEYNHGNDAWKTESDYSSGTSFISTGVGHTSYFYRVRACNNAGKSEWTIGTFATAATLETPKYFLDLFAVVDGEFFGEISGCGTADIYIDGKLVSDNATDYYGEWPSGTRYEIKDIQPTNDYEFNGAYTSALSGTITSSTTVTLSFSKKQHVHNLAEYNAKDPNCTENGNKSYFFCNDCGKYFSDVNATSEISKEQTIISALGHSYTNGICIRCGKAEQGVERDDPYFPYRITYRQDQFSDVPEKQWFTDSVAGAYELCLMKGNSDTTFNPYGDVTLAEAITMASRIHSIYTTGSENFAQSGGIWYQIYLDYALNNGIIDSNYYSTNVDVKATRAQFAEIFARALPDKALYPKNSISDYGIPDVGMNDGYAQYVYKLYRAGILTGGDAMGTFSPGTFITRAEAAAIVTRMARSSERKDFSL